MPHGNELPKFEKRISVIGKMKSYYCRTDYFSALKKMLHARVYYQNTISVESDYCFQLNVQCNIPKSRTHVSKRTVHRAI